MLLEWLWHKQQMKQNIHVNFTWKFTFFELCLSDVSIHVSCLSFVCCFHLYTLFVFCVIFYIHVPYLSFTRFFQWLIVFVFYVDVPYSPFVLVLHLLYHIKLSLQWCFHCYTASLCLVSVSSHEPYFSFCLHICTCIHFVFSVLFPFMYHVFKLFNVSPMNQKSQDFFYRAVSEAIKERAAQNVVCILIDLHGQHIYLCNQLCLSICLSVRREWLKH